MNVEEWLADMGDINAELQRSTSTSSLPMEGGATSTMTSDYDSEDYGDGPSDSPVPSEQPHSISQDEEERSDSTEMDKDWGTRHKPSYIYTHKMFIVLFTRVFLNERHKFAIL